jgi:3-dehydroquinate synthase
MITIPVPLGDRSYPILLGSGISRDIPALLREKFPRSRFALVTNTTIESLYRPLLTEWKRELDFAEHVIPDGEQYKNLTTWSAVLDSLLGARIERSGVVIAFGGGVVGDITGFAAAACLRGVNHVQVPTTLLAMVDSSVGGKTGVNHTTGKNLIGAFHQPRLVAIDTDFLKTLARREFLAGYAELYKYAFIGGADMFSFVRDHHRDLVKPEAAVLAEGIRRSVEIKARIVAGDERERGSRALLNFGHTFAHAIERFFRYGSIMHGEAVWWGIACACDLGRRAGTIPAAAFPAYDAILRDLELPPIPHPADPDALYEAMFADKKVAEGKIRFVLPVNPGEAVIRDDIAPQQVLESLKTILSARLRQ